MKSPLPSLLLIAFPMVAARAAEPPTSVSANEGTPVSSRITEVVVYADRAQVTRVGSVTLPSEAALFAFTTLPGWIDEGSVRVVLNPADAGQILDVQVRRTFLARTSDEEFLKAEAAAREISDQIGTLDDEKTVLDAQAKQVDSIRAFSMDKLPKDAATREVKPEEYSQSVKFVATSLREIATARRELERKRRDLQPELEARQKKLNELRQRAQLEQRTVVVTAKGTGKPATLSLSYLLPGATWEPVHELRAAQNAANVSLASFAVVMQTTGEDWTDVALSLSTQRPTQTMRIPELDALLVGGRRLPPPVTGGRDTFAAANTSFEAMNSLWFNFKNPDVLLQHEYIGNQAKLFDNARRVEQVFQTLQQRGTTAHFPALAAQTIRSDGRSARVPIGRWDFAAQHRILATPELSLNASRVVDLANSAKQPLLPGQVALFLSGAFLGQTATEFVAPGEEFSLYLGMADHIKLTRTLDKKRSAFTRGGAKTKMQVSFLVAVENLSDSATVLQLSERIPVAESEDVRISSVRIQPEGKPDAKGLLRWDLNLAAKQTREFRIEYAFEYPTELASAAAPVEGKAGAADSETKSLLRWQIQSLEKQF